MERFALVGSDIAVRDLMGTVRAEGRVVGVDDDARLLVEGPEGVVALVAGEVTLRDPAGRRP